MEKSVLVMLVIFVGWALTSFACHFCANMFLKGSDIYMAGVYCNVIIITGMQIIFCLTLTSISDENDTRTTSNKFVILAAHACATFTTNWSMAVTYAASTFAIKLIEPLTSALLQRLYLGVTLSYIQWFTIPLVIYGAILFTGDSEKQYFYISQGSILAFISNMCLALRNVYMKNKHLSSTKFPVKHIGFVLSLLLVCCVGLLVVLYLVIFGKAPPESVYLYSLLIGSSLFHVIYSYISTVIVLKHYTVLGHAFGNILKRLLVISLLYMTGSRNASMWNFMGLLTCIIGLIVYGWSKFDTPKTDDSTLDLPWSTESKKLMRIVISVISTLAVILAFAFLSKYYFYWFSYNKWRNSEKNGVFQLVHPNIKISRWRSNLESNISLSKPLNFSIDDFYSVDLVENPEKANKLSPLLTTRRDVIAEAQRIHMNIFKSLLGRYKYAMLLDYTPSENKGDSAIVVGEVALLRKLNINVIFTCTYPCPDHHLDRAQKISKNYTDEELVILFHGGGSVIGYPETDRSHSKQIPRFMRFTIIMFPQSILYIKIQSQIDFCKKLYASHPRLIILWRDKTSYKLGKTLFPKVHSLLAPDMTYQIGFVPRFMAPTYDIIWIKRLDEESPVYETPKAPEGIRMHVSDYWYTWQTPRGTSPMEDTFLITTNGMMFLQRGRIVITDRLHGHILSTLLGIPHVYIDNKQRKISNYHNTWTAGLENVVLANSGLDAVAKAMKLLLKLKKELPEIKGFYTDVK